MSNKAFIDLQNYIQQKHGVNVHLTKEFKNALNNLSALLSEIKNGSAMNKLKNTCSSGKKVPKKTTKKLNKNQIRLKLNILQKNLQKEHPNDDPEIKELIDIFAEKNDIIAQLLHPDNREILDVIFDEIELSDDNLLSNLLQNHEIKELISAIEQHEKNESELDIYNTVLELYDEYITILNTYDKFDQEIMQKHNSTSNSTDKLQRQLSDLKKTCENDMKTLNEKITETTSARDNQIRVIFKCKSTIKPKFQAEITDLLQKFNAEVEKMNIIGTRYNNDNSSVTEDELKESLDKLYNYNVLGVCKEFLNTDLPNDVSIFITDILKHKYYEAEKETYEKHVHFLSNLKPELISTKLLSHYNDKLKKAIEKDQKLIQDKIIHSNTLVLQQTFNSIEQKRSSSIQELQIVSTKLDALYDNVKQNTTNISAEIDEICHLRYTFNGLIKSCIDNLKKITEIKRDISNLKTMSTIFNSFKSPQLSNQESKTNSMDTMSFGAGGDVVDVVDIVECSCLSYAIYDTYKELYLLYYTPTVLKSQVLILNGIGNQLTELK